MSGYLSRRYNTPDGGDATVYELRNPAAETGRSLLLVSDDGLRRLDKYPPHWRELSWSELWVLTLQEQEDDPASSLLPMQ